MAEVVQTEPWSGVQPYLKTGFGEAANLYDTYTPSYYEGDTQAQFSPDQLTAQRGIRDFATGDADTMMNQALDAYSYGTSSSILDVANNPYVTGMAQAAADRAFSGLVPQLSGIRQGSIQSGGYGGGRQGIAEGTAIAGAADSATRAAADIYGQAYGQGLQHQLGTLGQTGSLMETGFKPYEALSASGAEQRAREQALIEDAQKQHEWTQQLPYERLNRYMNTISGSGIMGGGYGTETSPGQSGLGRFGDILTTMGSLGSLSDWASLFR